MNKYKNTIFIISLALLCIPIVLFFYYTIKSFSNEAPKTNYEAIIDSLKNENYTLDSLYDIERDKKEKTRILYKKVSVKDEIDSLSRLKQDLNNIKNLNIQISDSINPDSLKLLLIKELNF